jgi:hypothetical protein
MVKRAKNPAQLTEEEKDMFDQIILMTGAVFNYITTKDPKDVAENWISSTKWKKRIASSYLLLNTRNIEVSQVLTPANLNKELAKTMLDNANAKDPTDITTDMVGTTENNAYINSSDMTEILHCLTIGNIYENIIGKNEVRRLSSQRGRRPKDSDRTNTKSPGRPSAYITTQKVQQLKTLISKPEAYDRIRKALVESRLIYKFLKFLLQTLYYAARQDRSVADKLFRAFAPDIAKDSQIKKSLENFWELDESKLDELSDEFARISADTYLRYDVFLFVNGALDIMSKAAKNSAWLQ